MDLKHPFEIVLSIIGQSPSFYWFKCFLLLHLVLHDIILHIPVHDQSKPDVLKDMRNDGAYDAFDSEVHHECMSFGMAIVIFIE